MRKQMIENAAFEVASQVRSVEEAIDSALTEIAELQSSILRARMVAGVGTSTGHEAIEHLVTAVTSLVTARGGMVNCHAALKETSQHVPGLRTSAFGGAEECPPLRPAASLRAVA